MKILKHTEQKTVFDISKLSSKLIKACFDNVVTDLVSSELETRIGCDYQEFILIYDQIRLLENPRLEIENQYLYILYCTLGDSIHGIGMNNISNNEKQHIEKILSLLEPIVE